MAFPTWVTKYKEKGTSIRKKGNKYYKYRVHSERRKDKKYPVLIQDEFLGVITKEDGFIPSKKRLIEPSCIEVIDLYTFSNNGIFIEEYGAQEIEELKKIYLLKIENKLYFSKLSDSQKELLYKHGVNYHDGIFNKHLF